MSQILKQPVKTFSIGFDETDFNELDFSNKAAKKYNTEHYTEIVKPDALAILPKLIKHYGEPYGDSSAIPTYYVSELARKYVPMVLSGDGGDECFAGYGSYMAWMQDYNTLNGKGWRRNYFNIMNKIFPSRYRKTDELSRWLRYIHYISAENRSQLWKKEFRMHLNEGLKLFSDLRARSAHYTLANQVQYMDMQTYMPYDILTKVDVASMIHSLEVRTPLIDKDVWEFAATIPEEFNIRFNADERKWQGKLLLKKLLAKDFDNDFINRKKMGFAVPLTKWFSEKGDLRMVLEDYLLSSDSTILFYFEKEKIKQMLEQMNTGPLWLLLFLEEWLRNFKSEPAGIMR
jgi:asparagine synthase (glutamine-hydrolysing)